jgi:adenosine deaminase
LVQHLAENNIHLEVCPTSNIQINVYSDYPDHPVDLLYKAGVSIGINTDTRSLNNTTLTAEYGVLASTFDWGIDHFYQCNLNALSHAFIPEHAKQSLRKTLNKAYRPYLSLPQQP